jgi:hypothetical protein
MDILTGMVLLVIFQCAAIFLRLGIMRKGLKNGATNDSDGLLIEVQGARREIFELTEKLAAFEVQNDLLTRLLSTAEKQGSPYRVNAVVAQLCDSSGESDAKLSDLVEDLLQEGLLQTKEQWKPGANCPRCHAKGGDWVEIVPHDRDYPGSRAKWECGQCGCQWESEPLMKTADDAPNCPKCHGNKNMEQKWYCNNCFISWTDESLSDPEKAAVFLRERGRFDT